MLFEVSKNADDYDFVERCSEKLGKQRFMQNMAKFLKPIGLKLKSHDARQRKRKKSKSKKKSKSEKKNKTTQRRQSYSLQRLFDIKLNINS